MIKSAFFLVFLMAYTFVSVKPTLSLHFCGNHLEKIAVWHATEKGCCEADPKMEHGCCHNENISFDVDNHDSEIQTISPQFAFVFSFDAPKIVWEDSPKIARSLRSEKYFFLEAPPPQSTPVFIRFRKLII